MADEQEFDLELDDWILIAKLLKNKVAFVLLGGKTLEEGFQIFLLPMEDAVHYGDDGSISRILDLQEVIRLYQDPHCRNKSDIQRIWNSFASLHRQLDDMADAMA